MQSNRGDRTCRRSIERKEGGAFALLAVSLILLASVSLSSCAGYTSRASSAGGSGQAANPGVGVLSPNPTSLSFGSTAVGSTAMQSVVVTNTGTAAANISQSTISGAGFTIVSGNAGTSIAVGQSATIQVQFAPTSPSAVTGMLTVTSDASNSPLAISLSGTGTQGGLSANPASISFGNLPVGNVAPITVTLSNTGTAAVSITAESITGAGFTMAGLSPQSLTPGQTTSFTVTFAPTTATNSSGSVSITSSAPGSPLTIALSGTGTQPQISANPTGAGFGSVTIGNSNSQPITLTNNGNATLTFSQITLSGAGMSQTGLSTSTTIAAGGNMMFNAVFTPASIATINGSITLTTNGTPSPLTINLTGTGVAATLLLGTNPASLNFGNVNDGSNSSLPVLLTNNGNSNITISSVTVLGAGFSASGIPNGTVLTPGQSGTLTVTFAPTTPGAVSGASVSIASNATNSPTTISLSGTGTHSVLLSWMASSTSAVTYNVFRGNAPGGEGATPLNTSPISETSFTDPNVASGLQYFYTVEAVDSGGSSNASNEANVTIPTP